MIPYGRQNISEEDIAAVSAALKSDYLTQGPLVGEFERHLRLFTGANHAIAVNSATSALHIACLALGVTPGDVVWTSAISFVASANAARYCGADVDFVDIDYDSFNISTVHLERKLRESREKNQRLPKVVIPVAMAGQPAEMETIAALSKEYGFKVLEDASHALGATYKGEKVGSGLFSDISVFSFHPVKMITTGEGGACTTNDPVLAAKMQRLRSHGITRDRGEMLNPESSQWYYEQQELGFNYRITDFQCALGISQLDRLPEFTRERRAIASLYESKLDFGKFALPKVSHDRESSFHLYVVRLIEDSRVARDQMFEALRLEGILVNLHYIPIYRHPYYSQMDLYNVEEFPNAEKYFRTAMSLPIYPGLSESQVSEVVAALQRPAGYQVIF